MSFIGEFRKGTSRDPEHSSELGMTASLTGRELRNHPCTPFFSSVVSNFRHDINKSRSMHTCEENQSDIMMILIRSVTPCCAMQSKAGK